VFIPTWLIIILLLFTEIGQAILAFAVSAVLILLAISVPIVIAVSVIAAFCVR